MGPGPYLSTSPANVASSRLGQLTTKTPTHAHVPKPCGCPGPLLNSQHRPPAPLPASWPSSRCGQRQGPAASRVPAPLRHCCSSLAPGKSHRAIHCSCPAPSPWPGRAPLSLGGWGTHAYCPSLCAGRDQVGDERLGSALFRCQTQCQGSGGAPRFGAGRMRAGLGKSQ